jgi:superfamily II DNA or RNA helicase
MVSVMSIQWLSLHYREIKARLVVIVIDEAHHVLAGTYSSST